MVYCLVILKESNFCVEGMLKKPREAKSCLVEATQSIMKEILRMFQ